MRYRRMRMRAQPAIVHAFLNVFAEVGAVAKKEICTFPSHYPDLMQSRAKKRRRSRFRYSIPGLSAALRAGPGSSSSVHASYNNNVGLNAAQSIHIGASPSPGIMPTVISRNNDSQPNGVTEGIPALLAGFTEPETYLPPDMGAAVTQILDPVMPSPSAELNHLGTQETTDALETPNSTSQEMPMVLSRASHVDVLDEEDVLNCAAAFPLANWRVLWGLLLTNGANKFTKTQYQSMRVLLDAVVRNNTASWKREPSHSTSASEDSRPGRFLPHYSTLQRTYRPILMKSMVPRAIEVQVDVDQSKAGASSRNATCQVQVVVPSEYARADMATSPVWSLIQTTSAPAHADASESPPIIPTISTSDCVDSWPLIAARRWFYGPQRALSLDDPIETSYASSFAETDDVVDVTLTSSNALPEPVVRCFSSPEQSSRTTVLRATVIHSWTVHHSKRREDPQFIDDVSENVLSERDILISKHFNYVSYTSPSDSVSVSIPPMPVDDEEDVRCVEETSGQHGRPERILTPRMTEALKARRAAMKERRSQIEAAWRGFKTRILKPGDYVVLLRPCHDDEIESSPPVMMTSVDRCARICLVSRFWTEKEERNRHIFWIPGGADLTDSSIPLDNDELRLRAVCASLSSEIRDQYILPVRNVSLMLPHCGDRGYAKYSPVRSIGTLETGEDYFVYRFLLYWDGFEVQTGKSASGDGFYLICLNLPIAARSSPSAVRVLSLTPPGVAGDSILKTILDDVLQGMTTGFVDIDADGRRRRIFLDLVGFVGDTPALNHYLDVLGHNATSCCHLCRFRRGSSTLIGSRYATGHAHGMMSHARRGFFQHTAVRDCGAQTEACRLLGMKPNSTSSSNVLIQFRNSMQSVHHDILTKRAGQPVVPHELDPYTACFIAPDHLLTGHFRDCLNLALKLLPSAAYRNAFEVFALAYLRDARLPLQNRLVDHDKKSVFSMSMSEMYALAIVAETAFHATCIRISESESEPPMSTKCRDAVLLVASGGRLLSSLLYLPSMTRDGFGAVQAFERDHGRAHLRQLQVMTDAHVDKVADICRMQDSDVLLLDNPRLPRQKRAEVLKTQRETMTAIRLVDKPNVHRLRELVYTTLPMVGYIGRVGELVLERAHQDLKRAIKQSNNKSIQLHSMRSATINDWQGRLTLLVAGALSGDKSALRGCLRFLVGRDRMTIFDPDSTDKGLKVIHQAMGPHGCFARELLSMGRSVLSPRIDSQETMHTWRLHNIAQVIQEDQEEPSAASLVLESLQRAYKEDLRGFKIQIGENLSSVLPNNVSGLQFKRDDVLQVLTYFPNDPSFHLPFAVQVNCMETVFDWEKQSGISLWCALYYVSLTPATGAPVLLAAVLPVEKFDTVTSAPDQRFYRCRVRLSDSVTFLRMDGSIRPAGVIHDCYEANCAPQNLPNSRSVSHIGHTSPLQGGIFLALTREKGYPPRQG